MSEKSSDEFQIDGVEDTHERDTEDATPAASPGKRDIPVVRFRNRPRRQTSNKTTLLVGGAALVIVIILLLKFF